MSLPQLSFVIPAYNEEALIGQCLDSVLKEIARSGVDSEVVVVNNASIDRTGEIARSYPGVRVVDEPKKGLVNARHAGFEASTAEIVANIDSDTMLPAGWISTVMREFAGDAKLVGLSGPFIYYDLSVWNRALVRLFYYLTWLLHVVNHHLLHVGAVIQGGNFVFTRSAWLRAGGYDRSIAFYGEDTDVAVRLSRVGHVKWTFRLPMLTSGRRLEKEGVFKTASTYVLNYFWVTFRGKPATREYTDVRPK